MSFVKSAREVCALWNSVDSMNQAMDQLQDALEALPPDPVVVPSSTLHGVINIITKTCEGLHETAQHRLGWELSELARQLHDILESQK